jgi:hypothetical protein
VLRVLIKVLVLLLMQTSVMFADSSKARSKKILPTSEAASEYLIGKFGSLGADDQRKQLELLKVQHDDLKRRKEDTEIVSGRSRCRDADSPCPDAEKNSGQ